ncbi:hypothetical protein F511_06471 [Dorcoceras hygrometricum]|uniref:Uncharacterized protein n=1 Tax=Dorcoceras hygrometricum TaxID=472368 RepID=A0A2Z7C6J8_9LAMI|nr:hypothetical protein F511_06471 [Dorcoceras hygrometricum]
MGIDQLKFKSVQLGYLNILQLGNTDPNNKSRKRKYEVKPQYEEQSKQQIMQHSINQCYEMHEGCQKSLQSRPAYQLAKSSHASLYTMHGVSTGEIIDLTRRYELTAKEKQIPPGFSNHDRKLSKAATTQENQNSKNHEATRTRQPLRDPLPGRFTPPSWYQSKEQLKENPAPPISFKIKGEITENLPEKGHVSVCRICVEGKGSKPIGCAGRIGLLFDLVGRAGRIGLRSYMIGCAGRIRLRSNLIGCAGRIGLCFNLTGRDGRIGLRPDLISRAVWPRAQIIQTHAEATKKRVKFSILA